MRLSVACKVLLATSTVLVAVPPSTTVVSGFQPSRHADVMRASQSSPSALIRTNPQGLQVPSALHAKLGQYNLDVGDLFDSEDATGKEKKKRERAEKAKAEQEAKAQQRAAKEKARAQAREARKKADQESRAQKEKARAESKSNKAKEESKKPATSTGRRRSTSNAPSTGGIDLSKPINSLIAPLAPVAAIGAGRAYLTRREKLEEERKQIILQKAREEQELARRLAEIESKKDANGVSRCFFSLAKLYTKSTALYVCIFAWWSCSQHIRECMTHVSGVDNMCIQCPSHCVSLSFATYNTFIRSHHSRLALLHLSESASLLLLPMVLSPTSPSRTSRCPRRQPLLRRYRPNLPS